MATLRPSLRKALLSAHVASSVGWLGAALCMFALAWTARFTGSRQLRDSTYDVMLLLTNAVVVPTALLALVTGVLSSVLTPWRLLSHWWVVVKFGITIVTAALSVFLLRPRVGIARHAAFVDDTATLSRAGHSLLAATTVSLSLYLFMTVISIYKPWGRTSRGRETSPRNRPTPDELAVRGT